jgi:hypothetical protein
MSPENQGVFLAAERSAFSKNSDTLTAQENGVIFPWFAQFYQKHCQFKKSRDFP